MKIAIANDHGGYDLKTEMVTHIESLGHTVIDFGSEGADAVDYPDFASMAAKAVQDGTADLGIVICGTGIGVSIAANKHKGIRCALCHDTFSAHATREHNDANMLAMGARVIGSGLARDIVTNFLGSTFEGGRHQERIDKITNIEIAE